MRIEEHGFTPSSIDSNEFVEIVGSTGLNYENCWLVDIDGLRDDVYDITEFSYDAAGRVAKNSTRTRHVMKNEDFDAHGRPRLLRVGFQSPFQLSFNTAGLSTKVEKGPQTGYFHRKAG